MPQRVHSSSAAIIPGENTLSSFLHNCICCENGYLSLFIATLIRSSPCLPSSTCALQLWLLYFSGKQLWERGTIKECFFLFFFLILLNYSPPKSLVAGQDTPRHTSNAFKSWPTRLTLWEVSAVIENQLHPYRQQSSGHLRADEERLTSAQSMMGQTYGFLISCDHRSWR